MEEEDQPSASLHPRSPTTLFQIRKQLLRRMALPVLGSILALANHHKQLQLLQPTASLALASLSNSRVHLRLACSLLRLHNHNLRPKISGGNPFQERHPTRTYSARRPHQVLERLDSVNRPLKPLHCRHLVADSEILRVLLRPLLVNPQTTK